jgi:hypothetical protein
VTAKEKSECAKALKILARFGEDFDNGKIKPQELVGLFTEPECVSLAWRILDALNMNLEVALVALKDENADADMKETLDAIIRGTLKAHCKLLDKAKDDYEQVSKKYMEYAVTRKKS